MNRYTPPLPGPLTLPQDKVPIVPRLMNDPILGPMFKKIVIECHNRLTVGGTFDADGKRISDPDTPAPTLEELENPSWVPPPGLVQMNPRGFYLHEEVLVKLGFTTQWNRQIVEEYQVFLDVRRALRLPEYLGWEYKPIAVASHFLNEWAVDSQGQPFFGPDGKKIAVGNDHWNRPWFYLAGIGHGSKAIGAVHPSFCDGAFLSAKRDHFEKVAVGVITEQVRFRQDEAARLGYAKHGGIRLEHLP